MPIDVFEINCDDEALPEKLERRYGCPGNTGREVKGPDGDFVHLPTKNLWFRIYNRRPFIVQRLIQPPRFVEEER